MLNRRKYFAVLETIRESGVCNMWAADGPLRQACPELSKKQASDVLVSWIERKRRLNTP